MTRKEMYPQTAAALAALPIRAIWAAIREIRGAGMSFERDERTKTKAAAEAFALECLADRHATDGGAALALHEACEAARRAWEAKTGKKWRTKADNASRADDSDAGADEKGQDENSGAVDLFGIGSETKAKKASSSDGGELAQLRDLLGRLIGRGAGVDADAVRAIVDERTNDLRKTVAKITAPTVVIVDDRRGEKAELRDMGIVHKSFPDLLRAANARTDDGARMNIMLRGPAGSGKTTAAKQLAKALDVPFYFCGAIDTEYKLLGYTDATGKVVRRPFRDAFSQPSVFLFDELDGSSANATLALNAAIANGACDFPDAIEHKHADCVIVAGTNTAGTGPTADYLGRFPLDKAFLDRWVDMFWGYDEALEDRLAGGNVEWLARVRRIRAKAETAGVKVLVTPRATQHGAALIRAGFTMEQAEEMTIRKGLSAEVWNKIKAA